jgi:hypothetical protein
MEALSNSERDLTKKLAVREGFEPSMPFDIHAFQACSFDHSDTSPGIAVRPPKRKARTLAQREVLLKALLPDQARLQFTYRQGF